MAQSKQKILKNAGKYTKKGHYEKAISEYRKLTQADYGETSLCNTIGDLLIRANNSNEAIVEYEKAGKYYEEKGFIPKALAIYKKILRYEPSRTGVYEKLAQLYSDQGLIQDAITQYEFLAKHHEHDGRIEEALDSYRQIADLDPTNLSIRERLATLYSQQGFKEKACAERVKIGERFIKRGETMAAIKSFEAALVESHDDEAAMRGIVSVHLAEKRIDDAREVLNKILEKTPDNISALSTLGRLHMDSGNLDEAIEVFRNVYKLDPSQEGVNEILGRIYILKGNYEEAFKQLKEIISVAMEREDYDRALNILDQLQGLEQNNVSIREKKVEIYQKQNRHEEAKATFREMAEIYYNDGKLEEAYNIYERLFSMDPQDSDIKQRFNQISIELKGRPIEISKLVDQPAFDSVLDDKELEKEELLDLSPDVTGFEEDSDALESLFDTSEIEKISIPMFDEPASEGLPDSDDEILADDIFSIDMEDDGEDRIGSPAATAVAEEAIGLTEDQSREFRIEAGVFMKYGLLDKAAERLKSILVINPNDEETLERLTEVYEKMGKPDLVAQTIENRADILIRNDEIDQAVDLLKQGLDVSPGNVALESALNSLDKTAAVPAAAETGGDMVPMGSDFEPLVDLETMESDAVALAHVATVQPEDYRATDDSGSSLSNNLSDVVREFREELISRPQGKDADTHYDLGIAYKEMGLLDEAIAEFKLTLDFPTHMAKSSSLLAHCYIEKDEAEMAVKLLGKVVKNADLSEMEMLSVQYDLAQLHDSLAEPEKALKLLQEIQTKNKKYRNVPILLKDLRKRLK